MHLYSCIWISISFLHSQVKVTESKLVTHRWALQLGWERDISKQQHCCGHIHGQRLAPCSWAQTPVTRSNKKLWFYNGAELSPKINSNFYIYFLKHRISKKKKKRKNKLWLPVTECRVNWCKSHCLHSRCGCGGHWYHPQTQEYLAAMDTRPKPRTTTTPSKLQILHINDRYFLNSASLLIKTN